MINFLEETKDALLENNKTIDDIVYIGTKDGSEICSWDHFESISDFDYCNGFGTQLIKGDLIMFFSDGSFLFRNEYDGFEWWEFIKIPPVLSNVKILETVKREYYFL